MPEPSDSDAKKGQSPPEKRQPNKWRYAAIGIEFFSPIIGGSVAGYYLDQYFHTGSIWTLIGLVGGVVLAFHRLIVEVQHFRKDLTK